MEQRTFPPDKPAGVLMEFLLRLDLYGFCLARRNADGSIVLMGMNGLPPDAQKHFEAHMISGLGGNK